MYLDTSTTVLPQWEPGTDEMERKVNADDNKPTGIIVWIRDCILAFRLAVSVFVKRRKKEKKKGKERHMDSYDDNRDKESF